MNRIATRPDLADTLMDIARMWAHRSTCARNRVGAVIAIHGRTVSSGYNGAPSGMDHCQHVPADIADQVGTTLGCPLAVHAEANAIAFAARAGVSVDGGELFTTLAPCRSCAQLIINAGIWAVHYAEPYRDTTGVALLRTAGLDVIATGDLV